MRFGSLFAGIGGIDLGLERAGMECAWQVEWNEWCRKVLHKHWPDIPQYGDITELTGEELEPVDLICGGFPCQPVSEAGSRKASEDERWLWPEFARMLRILRPRFALVENVSGLLTADDGRAMGEVVGDLADLGYDAEWSIVSACSLGAPHTRERLFLLAHHDAGGQQASRHRGDHDGAKMATGRVGGQYLFAPAKFGRSERRTPWPAEPAVGRMADGLSPELDRSRLKALGNAVVPRVAEVVGRRIMDSISQWRCPRCEESMLIPHASDGTVYCLACDYDSKYDV